MQLNQVTIGTGQLPILLQFYQKLGFRLIVDSLPSYVRLQCPGGDATLSLEHETGVRPGGITLYFECPALDELVGQLQQAHIAFDHGPVDQPWLWREARLRDPDGNRLCLYHAGDNRINPPWRIKESS
ncbi:catechol 2,3-dioxygenase-like lactoylglutathione lyase family enzyme [Chitinivorax tropicus]|uniref:Catechol 2,3-dioxygenase-like lactoylglutathione lyase family enzyme n=1 Tax=Chitinivorax tropicus TaxID=714531 RepID=A0A840MMJ2_9PROT|nr:VOC family protein [Chitinivorax tropicus]MBB5018339.1 catechol 2,3-dioxygenase-like lactoylglutathione lyase family enzyme [Chitinivorax tropicus]